MNFLAHAEVARRTGGDDPAFVLGAVLPDLLPMAGVRLERADVPVEVAAGWSEHHRADSAFHAHPAFLTGVHGLRTDLRATALGTGPRRAAAHVGWELLLDDAVAGDRATIGVFRDALALGRDLTASPPWHDLLDRFAGIRASGPTTSTVLAERVRRACSRRPRLAFGAEDVAGLAGVLEEHRTTVAGVADAVLADVAAAAAP